MNLAHDHPIAIASRRRRADYAMAQAAAKIELEHSWKIRKSRRTGSFAPRGVFDSFTRALVRACAKRPRSSKAIKRGLTRLARLDDLMYAEEAEARRISVEVFT